VSGKCTVQRPDERHTFDGTPIPTSLSVARLSGVSECTRNGPQSVKLHASVSSVVKCRCSRFFRGGAGAKTLLTKQLATTASKFFVKENAALPSTPDPLFNPHERTITLALRRVTYISVGEQLGCGLVTSDKSVRAPSFTFKTASQREQNL
jgi:hypothetical protein